MLEAKRKAIETTDMEVRLKAQEVRSAANGKQARGAAGEAGAGRQGC
jgi:hypothetical protein